MSWYSKSKMERILLSLWYIWNLIILGRRLNGSCGRIVYYSYDQPIRCGDWHRGQRQECDLCLKTLYIIYPQGWEYYPGDVCEHGTYVGGCGIDWMCGSCESGYPSEYYKWCRFLERLSGLRYKLFHPFITSGIYREFKRIENHYDSFEAILFLEERIKNWFKYTFTKSQE